MKMDKVAGSHNDEFYTPVYAILPLLEYLKPKSKIWCSFDTKESNYVKVFESGGFDVTYTHIDSGDNFFDYPPPQVDYIISNPPYSLKTEVLERLFKLNIPFAMLVGVVELFESKRRFEMFKNNKFEIMYFDKRVSYLRNYHDSKPLLHPPFSSVYICHNILPQQIVFEYLDR